MPIEEKNNTQTLALFDLDGTITKRDTFIDFLKYAVGTSKTRLGYFLFFPYLLGYFLGIVSNKKLKEILVKYHFNNMDYTTFRKFGSEYSENILSGIIKESALEKIKWHQSENHEIAIVTASIEDWISGWCDKNNIKLFANTLEISGNKITGKFTGIYIHGKGKANVVQEYYNLSTYKTIYAYGDSKADIPMLNLANIKFYRKLA